VQWLLRAVLNFVAGLFHVLAEAVGRVAPNAGNNQKRGDEQEKNDTFGQCGHICV